MTTNNNSEITNSDQTVRTPEELSEICHYTRLLGEGSNGRTWLANDLKDGSRVAVKELKLKPDFKQLELFKREEEVLRSISIQGVPRLHQSVFSGKGCYLIQDYVPYPSLQDLLDQGRVFTDNETFQIIKAVAEILSELETNYVPPIIHRDIKPSNIMYNKSPTGTVEVYLIDFGAVANPQKRSEGSTIAGTFGFMSPEQIQGEPCIQSDFYSLGATAVYLLTGVSPYKIPTQVFELQFEPVIKEKAPNTSPQMVALLHKLLARNVENRPKTATEIVDFIRPSIVPKNFHFPRFSFIRALFHNTSIKSSSDAIDDDYANHVRMVDEDIEAHIVAFYTLRNIPRYQGFEYVYDVRGKTYCGFCRADLVQIENVDKEVKNSKLIPDRCVVHIDLFDPKKSQAVQNQIISLSSVILKQYKSEYHRVKDDYVIFTSAMSHNIFEDVEFKDSFETLISCLDEFDAFENLVKQNIKSNSLRDAIGDKSQWATVNIKKLCKVCYKASMTIESKHSLDEDDFKGLRYLRSEIKSLSDCCTKYNEYLDNTSYSYNAFKRNSWKELTESMHSAIKALRVRYKKIKRYLKAKKFR